MIRIGEFREKHTHLTVQMYIIVTTVSFYLFVIYNIDNFIGLDQTSVIIRTITMIILVTLYLIFRQHKAKIKE